MICGDTFVVARDRKQKKVLVGGLGTLGVGEMWFDEVDRHKDYDGYEDAPEMDYREFSLTHIKDCRDCKHEFEPK